MSSPSHRDELERRLLTGEAAPSDPDVARSLEGDPELAASVEELLEAEASLSALRDQREADLRAAESLAEEPHATRRLQDQVQAWAQPQAQPGGRLLRRVGPLVAAAAAVLAGWFLWPDDPGPAPDPGIHLSPNWNLEIQNTGNSLELRWQRELGPGEHYLLRFSEGDPSEPFLEEEVDVNHLSLPVAEIEGRRNFEVQVLVVGEVPVAATDWQSVSID